MESLQLTLFDWRRNPQSGSAFLAPRMTWGAPPDDGAAAAVPVDAADFWRESAPRRLPRYSFPFTSCGVLMGITLKEELIRLPSPQNEAMATLAAFPDYEIVDMTPFPSGIIMLDDRGRAKFRDIATGFVKTLSSPRPLHRVWASETTIYGLSARRQKVNIYASSSRTERLKHAARFAAPVDAGRVVAFRACEKAWFIVIFQRCIVFVRSSPDDLRFSHRDDDDDDDSSSGDLNAYPRSSPFINDPNLLTGGLNTVFVHYFATELVACDFVAHGAGTTILASFLDVAGLHEAHLPLHVLKRSDTASMASLAVRRRALAQPSDLLPSLFPDAFTAATQPLTEFILSILSKEGKELLVSIACGVVPFTLLGRGHLHIVEAFRAALAMCAEGERLVRYICSVLVTQLQTLHGKLIASDPVFAPNFNFVRVPDNSTSIEFFLRKLTVFALFEAAHELPVEYYDIFRAALPLPFTAMQTLWKKIITRNSYTTEAEMRTLLLSTLNVIPDSLSLLAVPTGFATLRTILLQQEREYSTRLPGDPLRLVSRPPPLPLVGLQHFMQAVYADGPARRINVPFGTKSCSCSLLHLGCLVPVPQGEWTRGNAAPVTLPGPRSHQPLLNALVVESTPMWLHMWLSFVCLNKVPGSLEGLVDTVSLAQLLLPHQVATLEYATWSNMLPKRYLPHSYFLSLTGTS